jgi:hypothetical protein
LFHNRSDNCETSTTKEPKSGLYCKTKIPKENQRRKAEDVIRAKEVKTGAALFCSHISKGQARLSIIIYLPCGLDFTRETTRNFLALESCRESKAEDI